MSGPHTFDELARGIFRDGDGRVFRAVRPHMTASEAADVSNAMGYSGGRAAGEAESLKLLEAEFGKDRARTALAAGQALARSDEQVRSALNRSGAGNAPKAVLAFAKAAMRRQGS